MSDSMKEQRDELLSTVLDLMGKAGAVVMFWEDAQPWIQSPLGYSIGYLKAACDRAAEVIEKTKEQP